MPHLATDTFDLKPVFIQEIMLIRYLDMHGDFTPALGIHTIRHPIRSKRCELLCDHTIGVIKGSY